MLQPILMTAPHYYDGARDENVSPRRAASVFTRCGGSTMSRLASS
jgi:hypothetical protein